MLLLLVTMRMRMMKRRAGQPCVHHQYFTHPMRQPVTLHIFLLCLIINIANIFIIIICNTVESKSKIMDHES